MARIRFFIEMTDYSADLAPGDFIVNYFENEVLLAAMKKNCGSKIVI